MIYVCFAYKDRRTKAFTGPILDHCSKENYIEKMKRAFIVDKPEVHAQNKDLSMYYLGVYDDTKATFDLLPEPEFVLEVDELEWKGDIGHDVE